MDKYHSFSPLGYRQLLNGFLDIGYCVSTFTDAKAKSPHLVLRHDIDMSLEAALEIAKIENELGVHAHYFVLLRTEMYNLFSERGLSILGQIGELGHKIGLHFDASLYSASKLEEAASWEIDCLNTAIGSGIEMVSFHRPSKTLLGKDSKIGGQYHTYQPRWFNDMAYCSDSRGHWSYGHPLDFEEVKSGHAIQLLTHPIWWFKQNEETAVERLDAFVGCRQKRLQQQLAINCDPYRNKWRTTTKV